MNLLIWKVTLLAVTIVGMGVSEYFYKKEKYTVDFAIGLFMIGIGALSLMACIIFVPLDEYLLLISVGSGMMGTSLSLRSCDQR